MKNRQLEIQKFLLSVDQADKATIYKNVSFGYYHNWEKHLGQLLSKMVKNGLVERVKPGVFRHKRMGVHKEWTDPNQKALF